MKTFCRSILLVIFAVLRLTARGEAEPKIFWGQPVQEWSLGISTTNKVFPEGVPSIVDVHLRNDGNVIRMGKMFKDSFQSFKVEWLADSGETLEQAHPPIVIDVSSGRGPRKFDPGESRFDRAESADILARLPPGRGKLTVFISLGIGDDGNEQFLYSGELELGCILTLFLI